jgi:hypothetical protein
MKMSSSANRDITKCSPSKVSSSPAVQPSSSDPVSRSMSRTITRTISVPTTAEATRQPNESMPNAASPSAISHFPTSGCTIMLGRSVKMSARSPARIFSFALST